MQVYLLFAFFLILHFSDDTLALTEAQLKSAAKLLRKNCQPKTKVTTESIDNMHNGIWDNSPEAQCYAFCILSMYKLVDKEGHFDQESAIRQVDMLPKPRQDPIIATASNCKGSDQGDSKCEAAYNLLKCVFFDNKDNYFFP